MRRRLHPGGAGTLGCGCGRSTVRRFRLCGVGHGCANADAGARPGRQSAAALPCRVRMVRLCQHAKGTSGTTRGSDRPGPGSRVVVADAVAARWPAQLLQGRPAARLRACGDGPCGWRDGASALLGSNGSAATPRHSRQRRCRRNARRPRCCGQGAAARHRRHGADAERRSGQLCAGEQRCAFAGRAGQTPVRLHQCARRGRGFDLRGPFANRRRPPRRCQNQSHQYSPL